MIKTILNTAVISVVFSVILTNTIFIWSYLEVKPFRNFDSYVLNQENIKLKEELVEQAEQSHKNWSRLNSSCNEKSEDIRILLDDVVSCHEKLEEQNNDKSVIRMLTDDLLACEEREMDNENKVNQ